MSETHETSNTTSCRELSIELESRPDAPQWARKALESWYGGVVPSGGLQALLLVVSELVGNSVRHGPGEPIKVLMAADDANAIVRGEVVDGGQGEVAIREMSGNPLDGGLGLRLVDALVDRWGVREGTTVWFEMSTEREDWTDSSAYFPWM